MGIDPVTHKPRNDLNLLANLSQLLSTPQNLGPLMNPWDINNALRLQPNVAAEVAKLQVLQNIFQILNTSSNSSTSTSSLPNMNQAMALNMGSFPNNNANDMININNNNNAFSQVPNYAVGPNQTIVDHKYDNTQELYSTSLDTNCNKSLSSTTYEALDENRLPSLVNYSPEVSTVNNQIESNANSTTGDFFEGLEKLLDDGNSDFWKDFIK